MSRTALVLMGLALVGCQEPPDPAGSVRAAGLTAATLDVQEALTGASVVFLSDTITLVNGSFPLNSVSFSVPEMRVSNMSAQCWIEDVMHPANVPPQDTLNWGDTSSCVVQQTPTGVDVGFVSMSNIGAERRGVITVLAILRKED